MPRGRFLSRDVSTSERLADLKTDLARIVWSWGVPHTDRDGRLPGSPRVLRATVVPLLDVTVGDVAEAIDDLVRVGLAVLYSSNGTPALQLLKFSEHQPGMRYDREAPSKYGPPPEGSGPGPDQLPDGLDEPKSGGGPEEVPPKSGPEPSAGNDPGPDNSGLGPPEGKDQDQDQEEEKKKAKAARLAADVQEVWGCFLERRSTVKRGNPPVLNDTRRAHIKARLQSYSKDRVLAAVAAMFAPGSWYLENDQLTPELVFRSDEQLEKHEKGGNVQPTLPTNRPELQRKTAAGGAP